MKKLFTIALSVLMLISCFAISVSAAEVNYAQNDGASYAYFTESISSYWQGGLADDACELLTDGVIAYGETPFETVAVAGTSRQVSIIFDLGATYPDVKAIKFCGVADSNYFNGGNRGFCGDKALIEFSENGIDYARNKNFEMVRENCSEDGSETGFYNFTFTFDSDVKAKAVRLTIWSPVYVLSLSEIQIIGGGADPIVDTPEESSEEEYIEDSEDTTAEESTETTESAAESTETAESAAESKAEESATESKVEASSTDTTTDNEDGINPVVIVVIVVAVIAVAAVVVIVLKKKGA